MYIYIYRYRYRYRHRYRYVCVTLLAFIIAEDMSIEPQVILINKYSFLNYLK